MWEIESGAMLTPAAKKSWLASDVIGGREHAVGARHAHPSRMRRSASGALFRLVWAWHPIEIAPQNWSRSCSPLAALCVPGLSQSERWNCSARVSLGAILLSLLKRVRTSLGQ